MEGFPLKPSSCRQPLSPSTRRGTFLFRFDTPGLHLDFLSLHWLAVAIFGFQAVPVGAGQPPTPHDETSIPHPPPSLGDAGTLTLPPSWVQNLLPPAGTPTRPPPGSSAIAHHPHRLNPVYARLCSRGASAPHAFKCSAAFLFMPRIFSLPSSRHRYFCTSELGALFVCLLVYLLGTPP